MSVREAWEEMRRLGVAEDVRRFEALGEGDAGFVRIAEEERASLELEGVRLDRKVADAQTQISILLSERQRSIQQGRALLGLAAALLPFALWLLFSGASPPLSAGAGAAAFLLAAVGAWGWVAGRQHGRAEEARIREEDAVSRREAAETRRRLSELRQRLDRVARAAGFVDGAGLLKAQRRHRAAEEARRRLVERTALRDGARAREEEIAADLAPFREALGLPAGPPASEAVRAALAALKDLDAALDEERARAARLEHEAERLRLEDAEIARLEAALRSELSEAGVPSSLALPEAFLAVEAGRRRAGRQAELLEVEIPARRDAVREEERSRLAERLAALEAELELRGAMTAEDGAEGALPEPEAARRAAEEARTKLEAAEAERLAAERELAAAAREGGEKARDVEEELAGTEALLARATLFRDALDLARRTLSESAAAVYGDFTRGLAEASRSVLGAWNGPWEALAFGPDLSVSAVERGGRVATGAEIAAALSTGAREQIHLTARLAVLRYLGTGVAGVPLLLDDPLAGSDDERFAAIMEFLSSRVLAERPVLLVSCHGWRHERLLAGLPAAARERLALVTFPRGAPGPHPAGG